MTQPLWWSGQPGTDTHPSRGESSEEEESHRREGKGRHCWLGDGIVYIECRTRDLAPG